MNVPNQRLRRRVPTPRRKIHREVEDTVVRKYLESLDSPRALSVWLLFSAGEHRQLIQLEIDPCQYDPSDVRFPNRTADEFRRDYAATKLFSKCSGLSTEIDVDAVALQKWREAEVQNRLTNQRIRDLRRLAVMPGLESSVWFRAKGIISKILGSLDYSSFRDVGWSKGRTSSAYGRELTPAEKYISRLDVTKRARKYALSMLRNSPLWGQSALKADGPCSVLPSALSVVEGNTLITVPKNAKTSRVICYEPHLNIRLQLSVGAYIRDRLSRSGVNLDDQTINQRRARVGSKFGQLATIDLASASDTVALELVYELLPIEWAVFLDDLRSPYTLVDGQQHKNEKFSSMGNGYTFELESLIFYALCRAVTDDVTVYGDDLIIPSSSYTTVVDVLTVSGFKLNTAKSFAIGGFRESCGGDYFGGLWVTPPYIRRRLTTMADVATFWNRVYEQGLRVGASEHRALFDYVRSVTGLPLGPHGLGDGHLSAPFDIAVPTRAASGWDAWYYNTYLSVGVGTCAEVEEGMGVAYLCAATDPKTARVSELLPQRVIHKVRLTAFAWPSVMWQDLLP